MRDPAALRSASTISFTRELKSTWRFHPRTRSALAGLPRRSLKERRVSSDSIGAKIRGRMRVLDFGRSEVPRVDFHDDLARLRIDALFVLASAAPPDGGTGIRKTRNRSQGERFTYLISIPSRPNDFSTNSRTGWVSPVASTKSSA